MARKPPPARKKVTRRKAVTFSAKDRAELKELILERRRKRAERNLEDFDPDAEPDDDEDDDDDDDDDESED